MFNLLLDTIGESKVRTALAAFILAALAGGLAVGGAAVIFWGLTR